MIIKSLNHLRKLAYNKEIEIRLILNFGLFSRKNISWRPKIKKWYVYNWIDDTQDWLTDNELKKFTNIPEAIEKKALTLS